MNGRFRRVAKFAQARLLVWIGLAACIGLTLAGCQTADQAMDQANHVYEQNSLMGNMTRLAPWVAPDKSKGIVIQFLPFSGVPVNTADAIYKNVRAHSTEEGLKLALRLDEPATYRVRTLISAVGTTDVSTFIFIVEIYDVAGNRVHRFVGQEYGVVPNGEPWSGIDGDTERHLGERILLGVKAWVTRST
jgi:hypothetical protein